MAELPAASRGSDVEARAILPARRAAVLVMLATIALRWHRAGARGAVRRCRSFNLSPTTAGAARFQPAASPTAPRWTGRAQGPLDPGVPRLHPLPRRVPDHPGADGAGAEAVADAARQHPPRAAVRVGGPDRDTPDGIGEYAHGFDPTPSPPPPTCRRWRRSRNRCRWCSKVPAPRRARRPVRRRSQAAIGVLDPQARMAGVIQPPLDPDAIAKDMAALTGMPAH